jgi:SAM-dependent methyltransferase
MSPEPADVVRWHDLECGGYDVDLELWRELAAAAAGPVLDVGAGTGRGRARPGPPRDRRPPRSDADAPLLEELRGRARAQGLDRGPRGADARELAVAGTFAAILVPMQTIQLLGGPEGARAFLSRARGRLRPGGLLAAALADALESYDAAHTEPPLPDMGEWDGVLYASRPVAVRPDGDGVAIVRVRETVDRDGRRDAAEDVIRLDRLDPATLEAEGAAAGFAVQARRRIAQTPEYVGSTVVVLRAP